MIIELTGLPGAGKTTSESWIISCYRNRGFRVMSRSELKASIKNEKLFHHANNHYALRFHSNWLSNWKGLINAGFGGRIFREVLTNPRRMAFLLLGEDIRLSTYYLQKYVPAGMGPSVYIPHEGFVHHSACIKVWTGGGFGDLPEKLLQKVPSEKFIILYFKISVDAALDRLLKRGIPEMWPSHIKSQSRIKEILLRFNEAIEGTVQKFQANGVKVLTIDASLEPQQVESRIKTILDNFSKIGNE